MKSKFIALFLGSLFAFLTAEIFLRVWGRLNVSEEVRNVQVPVATGPGKRSVLFIGNSYTAGPFVELKERFSERLQAKLGPDWVVQNISRGSMNTREQLAAIQKLRPPYPDVVFIMAGQPNAWNNFGYDEYLEEIGKRNNFVGRFGEFLSKNLHSVRFVQHLLYNLDSNQKPSMPDWVGAEYGELNEKNFYILIGKIVDAVPNSLPLSEERRLWMRRTLADKLKEGGEQHTLRTARLALNWESSENRAEVLEDIKWLTADGTRFNLFAAEFMGNAGKWAPQTGDWERIKVFLKKKQQDPSVQWMVGEIDSASHQEVLTYIAGSPKQKALVKERYGEHMLDYAFKVENFTFAIATLFAAGEIPAACSVLTHGIEAFPVRFREDNFWVWAASLRDICDPENSAKLERQLAELLKKGFVSEKELKAAGRSEVGAWRFHDLAKMLEFFHSRGSQVVFQTYLPMRRSTADREENYSLYTVAKNKNALLLDQFRYFKEKYPETEKRDFVYVQGGLKGSNDDHYSPEGHELVAQLVYDFMAERNFFEKK